MVGLLELKMKRETVDIPVIIVTGSDSDHDRKTAFNLGAKAYFTKPFDLNLFKETVKKILNGEEVTPSIKEVL